MFDVAVTIKPQGGGYRTDSFDHLLHSHIHLPGLDPAWEHTLIGVQVAGGGTSATLHIRSAPIAPMSLERHLQVIDSTPKAHVRVHDMDGQVLAETRLPAPLQHGQHVELGGQRMVVTGDPTWPGRHPDTGACEGDLDWQHVTLTDVPHPAPTAAGPE